METNNPTLSSFLNSDPKDVNIGMLALISSSINKLSNKSVNEGLKRIANSTLIVGTLENENFSKVVEKLSKVPSMKMDKDKEVKDKGNFEPNISI